jgi:hypothetical protein
VIADTMEPAYGFQSLLQFKAKFQPAYQPLYLTYPDPAALGSIATAIGRAYLPHLTLRQALRLLTKLHRPHARRSPVQQREGRMAVHDTVVTGRATTLRNGRAARRHRPSAPLPRQPCSPPPSGGRPDSLSASNPEEDRSSKP